MGDTVSRADVARANKNARARENYEPKVARAYYEANRERLKANASARRKSDPTGTQEGQRRCFEKSYHLSPRKRANWLFKSIRARCRQRGVEVTITRDWIEQRVVAGFCEVTGLPFDIRRDPRADDGHFSNPFAPSVDRIDRKKGYTPGNCVVVCWIYNLAKGPYTHAEVMRLARALLASEVLLDEEVA